jgi:hypothetical protein
MGPILCYNGFMTIVIHSYQDGRNIPKPRIPDPTKHKYLSGLVIGPNTLLERKSERIEEPNGLSAGKGLTRRRYRNRVWWLVRCEHGTRWTRQEAVTNKVGCSHCGMKPHKIYGLSWKEKPFFCLIWQPRTCLDCKIYFETLYRGQKRCKSCTKKHRHAMRRTSSRCRHLGVPFDSSVSFEAVFRRDNYICWLCGLPALKEFRGTYDDLAPELEHKVELSALNSPGHVWDNVACAHRKCNREKEILRSSK